MDGLFAAGILSTKRSRDRSAFLMAEVILRNVLKKIDEHTIVDRISLEVKDREFCVLVGPSGCGKTTTLRMIAGLEEVTDGEIWIGNRLVNGVPPKSRD